jgi:hypothetical protein
MSHELKTGGGHGYPGAERCDCKDHAQGCLAETIKDPLDPNGIWQTKFR